MSALDHNIEGNFTITTDDTSTVKLHNTGTVIPWTTISAPIAITYTTTGAAPSYRCIEPSENLNDFPLLKKENCDNLPEKLVGKKIYFLLSKRDFLVCKKWGQPKMVFYRVNGYTPVAFIILRDVKNYFFALPLNTWLNNYAYFYNEDIVTKITISPPALLIQDNPYSNEQFFWQPMKMNLLEKITFRTIENY